MQSVSVLPTSPRTPHVCRRRRHAGCSALLDNLFWCICDEGDGILIPAPYYPAFDNDLQASPAGAVQLPSRLVQPLAGAAKDLRPRCACASARAELL